MIVWIIGKNFIFLSTELGIDYFFELLLKLVFQIRFLSIWFIATLFITEIVFYIICNMCKNNQILILLISLFLTGIGYLYVKNDFPKMIWNIDLAITALIFVASGYIVKHKFTAKISYLEAMPYRKKVFLFLLSALGCFSISILSEKIYGYRFDMFQGLFPNPFFILTGALLGILMVMTLSMIIQDRNVLLNFMGRESIIYLAFHQSMFITTFIEISNKYAIFNQDVIYERLFRFVVVFLLTIIANTALAKIILKNNIMKKLIGEQ